MVDPGEDISDAAVREVLEETGIRTQFRSLESFRTDHSGVDGQTNLYFIVTLTPLTSEFTLQESEIADACWMPMEKFLSDLQFVGVYRALHEIAVQNL